MLLEKAVFSQPSALLGWQLEHTGHKGWKAEYRFEPSRRWRLDLAEPTLKLAVEVEGGIWTKGRHTRPQGFLNDLEKYNTLACRGWRLIRVTPDMVKTGEALTWIDKATGRILCA